jgi:nucleotide-binding universal stress UspA family protein
MTLLKTVIVAVDCSKNSNQVVASLKQINLNSKSKIIFTYVFPSPQSNHNLPLDKPQNFSSSFYQQKEENLKIYQSQYSGSDISIVRGDTAEEIIRLANIHKADLIIIGSRGLKGIKRILEDSISSQLVADAPCSVLVVK